MKNVTMSAEEAVIEKARSRALKEGKTLNAVFREWLQAYVAQDSGAANYHKLMKDLAHVSPGRRFSREEMNER